MSDVREFLDSYREVLSHETTAGDWPPELSSLYVADSCLKHSEGRQVYLVIDVRTGGKAVLRITSHDVVDQSDAEWAILSKLDHPGIPRCFGRLVTERASYTVREYIAGIPLDEAVAKGAFSAREVFDFALELCDILGYLHRQSPPVIHRDIKPQNVILKDDGTVVLTDFGIARTYKPDAESDTQYAGTLPYAPPEQYGYAQSTQQTDIYALGIMLIYLATGTPDRRDLPNRIEDKKLLALITRCIAFDPADRFASVDDIVRFIGKVHRPKRSIVLACLAGALALTLAVGGAFLLLQPPNAPDDSPNQPDPVGQATGGSPQDGSSSTFVDWDGALFDPTVSGNLAGNIGNGGIAVEGDGTVYFAASDGIRTIGDDGSLGDIVVDATGARYLNYHRGALYFSTQTGLIRADPQTGEAETVSSSYAEKVFVDNGRLYFENGGDSLNLYTAELDGTNVAKVSDFGSVYYRNVIEGHQYFANTSDGEALYRVNLETGEEQKLYDERSAWLSAYGEYLYFSDFSIPGNMVRMSLDGSETDVLFSGSYSYVNATPLGVFFTNPEAQQLEVMAHDGKSRTLLTEKRCGRFSVTSEWIFYVNKDDNDELWMMRPDGSDDHAVPSPTA